MKLTKTERKALAHMAANHRVNDRFMPMTVLHLAAEGLVEKTYSVVGYARTYWVITEAGRKALESAP